MFNSTRTEYWKSNERKYCDYCGCWIADNKSVSIIFLYYNYLNSAHLTLHIITNANAIRNNLQSIVFHEGGKRHKENVAKKLVEISRKSFKDEKERKKTDQHMRQMEDAAMKAYAQDIARGGDITTQELNAELAAATAAQEDQATSSQQLPGPSARLPRNVDPMLKGLPEDFMEAEEKAKRAKQGKRAKGDGSKEHSMWVESVTDDGNSYYWHIKSGGSFSPCEADTNRKSLTKCLI